MGADDAAARRPVRRRDRGDPRIRSGDAALAATRCKQVRLLPGREVPLDADVGQGFPPALSHALRRRPDAGSVIYRGVSDGLAPPGIEFYLPLFFDATDTLLDYLPANTVVVRGRRTCRRAVERDCAATSPSATKNGATTSSGRCSRPTSCSSRRRSSRRALDAFTRIDYESFKVDDRARRERRRRNFPTAAPQEWRVDLRAEQPLAPLARFLDQYPRPRVAGRGFRRPARSAARDAARARARRRQPSRAGTRSSTATRLSRSRVAPEMAGPQHHRRRRSRCIGEAQLFGAARAPGAPAPARARVGSAGDPARPAQPRTGLAGGARGIRRRPLRRPAGHAGRGPGRRVPGARIRRRRQAVRARAAAAPRHRATPARRPRARRCTSSAPISGPRRASAPPSKIRDVAAELLDLYAQRQAQARACSCRRRSWNTRPSRTAFPFEETADQAEAIRQVLAGSRRARSPMDRVVCGDVGFGKTEVAMRAAFVAVQAGKQVAVLVPTTLLAEQHTANFRDRFADWPVRIEALSRFRTGKETQRRARRHRERHGRHRHRHAPAAARARAFQGPRA